VYGSIDGGESFPYLIDEFHHNDPAEETAVKTYDISSWADGQAEVMIRFDIYNDNDWYWRIDDFNVSAEITGDLVYYVETFVDLPAYTSGFVEFYPPWDAIIGLYGLQVTSKLIGDQNNSNDVIAEIIHVEGPELSMEPTYYNFGVMNANDTATTTFDIWNSGIGILTYSLFETCNWVDISPTNGNSTGERDTIMIMINTTDLNPSNYYNCQILINSDGGTGVFNISVFITDGSVVLDVNQSIFDRGFPIRHALDGDWAAAQSFFPTVDMITHTDIYLRKFGTPEFDLTIELHQDHPQGFLVDMLSFTPSEVSSNWEWFTVDFSDTLIINGTEYFIVIPPAPSGVTTSFGYEWGYAFGNQYDNGAFWFTRDGGGLWRDLPDTYEFVFRIYGYN
jgi:hypothetical protein